ncbi:outer membrane lipase/esterase [Oxalobacteraceae bacterium GrIS 1.11]
MHQTKFALAMLTAAILAGCGGGSSGGDQTLKTKFSAQVTFGDSLSDVGSYAVGTIALLGGGKFTINGDNTATSPVMTGKNWTELMAAQFGLPAPCAAQTGLMGDATQGFNVAVVNHPGCYGYAQGGSRVTDAVGPGNVNDGTANGATVGALTVPVSTQIQNHLTAVGGKFKGDEVVFVTVGGNDTAAQLGILQAGAAAAGAAAGAQAFAQEYVGLLAAGATNPATAAQAIGLALGTENARPGHTDQSVVIAAATAAAGQPGNLAVGSPAVFGVMAAKAKADATLTGTQAGLAYAAAHGKDAVAGMAKAGADTASLVLTQIVANGANFVVVNNLPDFGGAPVGKAQSADTQVLIAAMVDAYNSTLKAALTGQAKVLLVDLYSISHDEIINPLPYGLTNTSTAACGPNKLGTTSLVCTGKNVIAGDVSHYMFADDRHPTPFEYSLIAKYVAEQMIIRGWL